MARGKKSAAGAKKNLPVEISNPVIRRAARRAGVKRIKGDVYEKINEVAKHYLRVLLHLAIQYKRNGRRKILLSQDAKNALKHLGRKYYSDRR